MILSLDILINDTYSFKKKSVIPLLLTANPTLWFKFRYVVENRPVSLHYEPACIKPERQAFRFCFPFSVSGHALAAGLAWPLTLKGKQKRKPDVQASV